MDNETVIHIHILIWNYIQVLIRVKYKYLKVNKLGWWNSMLIDAILTKNVMDFSLKL